MTLTRRLDPDAAFAAAEHLQRRQRHILDPAAYFPCEKAVRAGYHLAVVELRIHAAATNGQIDPEICEGCAAATGCPCGHCLPHHKPKTTKRPCELCDCTAHGNRTEGPCQLQML